jgi:hypothetical protein
MIYAYTQHENTVRIIETTCNVNITRLRQDRTRDVVEDVVSQLQATLPQPPPQVLLYAVMPLDKAVELRMRAPWLRIRLLQLDGKVIERLTGRPYDPKSEYEDHVVRQALRIFEIKGGSVRYLTLDEFLNELNGKRVAAFNDVIRQALHIVLSHFGETAELVKTCNNSDTCIEVNPLGHRSGYRISFPSTVGRLTPEQMAEVIMKGEVRIYYLEVDAQEVPLC